MGFLATINVPGYVPMDDDPPVFDTASEAWAYLADERSFGEDNGSDPDDGATLHRLREYAVEGVGPDVVHGGTPGYDGSHDLGLAYCVTAV